VASLSGAASGVPSPTLLLVILTTRIMEPSSLVSTPVSNDRGAASSKVKQLRIPSVQATSFRKASDGTKNAVIIRDHRKCWLCGAGWQPLLEVAHNVAASIPLEWVCSSFLCISLVLDFVLLVEKALTMYRWSLGKSWEYCQRCSTLRTSTILFYFAVIAM
jgi:hypothetical protein